MFLRRVIHQAGVFWSSTDNDVMMAHDSAAALSLDRDAQPRPRCQALDLR